MLSNERDPDRDPVDVLAEDFADRLRRGEHPSVSDYAAAHPDHADQLKELLPAVAQMEMLKRFRRPGAGEQSLPDRLGDFRIVRELGRGGMGVVFEAEQESLGRRVALKVLARHAQLDPKRRERFVREAQAAAKLHHTNIVPVFGVGEQDGLPYYVMQLIPGCGLHTLVRQWRKRLGKTAHGEETASHAPGTRPDGASGAATPGEPTAGAPGYGDWRFVAEVGFQTADALHYAHRQGVLHRDVKPANLILDSGIVWITDFGLAKMVDAEGLTATGDILGTLQYIPPECLAGNADPRSDVYGLGATLYELLTLEPPYAADSLARLVKQVADTDPKPPRELNPDIPRDLETIVLKAMARDPAGRYADAREMARDLEAFLDDRPITARRTTLLANAWRWCRRNPAVASLAATTAAALVLAAVAGWVGYARTTDALAREGDRRKEAERLQGEAERATADADRATADAQQMSARLEANLKLSLETFEKVFEAASGTGRQGFGLLMPPPAPRPTGPPGPDRADRPDRRPPGSDLAADKAAILEAILAFYDRFAEQNATNPRLRFEAAKASRRVSDANLWLGRPEKAVAAYQRAVALLEPLVAQFPSDEAMRTELAMVYLNAPAEAFPADREAPLRHAAELARGRSWLSGSIQFRVGWVREQADDWAGAEDAYREAVAAFASTAPAHRPTAGHLELAFARFKLAAVLTEQGNWPAARRVLEESIGELEPVVKRGDSPQRFSREWLATTYLALADVCKRQADAEGEERATASAQQYGGGFGGPLGNLWPWVGGPKKDPPRKDVPPKKD